MFVWARTAEIPIEELGTHFVAIGLVEHFVSPIGMEIVGDTMDTSRAILLQKDPHATELRADGIFAP